MLLSRRLWCGIDNARNKGNRGALAEFLFWRMPVAFCVEPDISDITPCVEIHDVRLHWVLRVSRALFSGVPNTSCRRTCGAVRGLDILTRKKDIFSQIVSAVQAGTPMTAQEEGNCPSAEAFWASPGVSVLLSARKYPGVNWPRAKRGNAPDARRHQASQPRHSSTTGAPCGVRR
jgi:hypothetical protein